MLEFLVVVFTSAAGSWTQISFSSSGIMELLVANDLGIWSFYYKKMAKRELLWKIYIKLKD